MLKINPQLTTHNFSFYLFSSVSYIFSGFLQIRKNATNREFKETCEVRNYFYGLIELQWVQDLRTYLMTRRMHEEKFMKIKKIIRSSRNPIKRIDIIKRIVTLFFIYKINIYSTSFQRSNEKKKINSKIIPNRSFFPSEKFKEIL